MIGTEFALFTKSVLSVPFCSKVFWPCQKWKDTLLCPASSGKLFSTHATLTDHSLVEDESKRRGDGVSRRNHIRLEMGLAGRVPAYTRAGARWPALHKPGMMAQVCTLHSLSGDGKGGPEANRYPQLCRKFEKCTKGQPEQALVLVKCYGASFPSVSFSCLCITSTNLLTLKQVAGVTAESGVPSSSHSPAV